MVNRSHCKHCGCSWSVHMLITYECTPVQTQVVDANVEKQIKDKATSIEIINQHLQSLEDRINKLEAEKLQVTKVSARFACFLKHNAIAAYDDAMCDYLEHLIQVEKGKVSAGGDRSRLVWLEEMKSMYLEEVKILEQAVNDRKSSFHVPTVEEIKKLYDYLCRLEIIGPMLKNAIKVAEAGDVEAMQHNEKRIQSYRKPPYSGNRAAMSQSRRSFTRRIRYEFGRVVNIFLPPWAAASVPTGRQLPYHY